MPTPPLESDQMGELKTRFPSMKRALFSRYHIGGCQSCAYQESSTLLEVCRHYKLNPAEVIDEILTSEKRDQAMQITPVKAQTALQEDPTLLLLDCRTREEHEAVKIENSILLTQTFQDSLFTPENEPKTMFLYDHRGTAALDICSWFHGHGLKGARVIQGGIDRWAKEVDSTLPRYRLEMD